MQKQGSSLFKVASILLLIWGVIAVIVNGIQLIDVAPYLKLLGGGLLFGMILLLLSTVVMAVAGIMGVSAGKKPEKAGSCQIIGIAALAMLLLGTILLLTGVGSQGVNWIFTIIGVVLTSLYIIGAKQQKNAPAEPVNPYGYNANNPYMNQNYMNQNFANQPLPGQQAPMGQPSPAAQAAAPMQNAAAQTVEAVQNTAAQAAESVQDTAAQAVETVQEAAAQAPAGPLYPWQKGYAEANQTAGQKNDQQ